MNKKYIIQKNEEIKLILNSKHKIVNKMFIVFYKDNNLSNDRYCVSISKKIGKANVRNYYKRRIKDIIMKNKYNNSKDYVIIVRNSILGKDYQTIANELSIIFKGENK